ncbi:MAG: DUF3040 domain-containing protein [Microthrixaceae bacterium]
MPLSEDEQRILREIEDSLYESDPQLAREVSSRTVHSAILRRIRLAAVGIVVALFLTIYLLTVHFLLAFVGFLVAFALGAVIESSIRQLGEDGLGELLGQITKFSGARRPSAPTGADKSDEN